MVDVTKISIGDEVTIRARVTSLENGLIYIGLDNEEISILGTEIISHEPRSLAQRLAGLTVEQIEAALARKDSALSEAFETAGTHIARARRDAGDLKRRPKNTGADIPATDQEIGDGKTAMAASSSGPQRRTQGSGSLRANVIGPRRKPLRPPPSTRRTSPA